MSVQRDTLRIVQVETFYASYLDSFYAANPALRTVGSREQTDALLRDGFSALHNIAPYLEPIGYEAHFIIANNGPAQMAWLREHGLSVPTGQDPMRDILRLQIERLDPDILYFSDCTSFDSRFVRTLARRPRLVVGWQAAPVPPGTDWSAFDVLLSGLSGMRAMALRLGARAAEHYMPGFPAWIANAIGSVEERHDLLFAGSYTPHQHARRNRLLTRLAEEAATGAFDCAFHLSSPPEALPPALARWARPAAFGLAMHQVLRSGRVVFDSRSDMTATAPDGQVFDVAGTETANMRLFETTGSGGFLLTEHHENLSRYFEIGREIETFRTEDELVEKLHHYLAKPEDRLAIARRGQERCLRDHSMSRRIHDFDAIMRRHLSATAEQGVKTKGTGMPKVTAADKGKTVDATNRPTRHFCTYFDSNYAARGLVMMDSILRFLPDARFHVLCLNDTAYRIVTERQPAATAILLSEMEAFDPDLAACRADRSKVEYYFTCTPCLPRLVLARNPDAEHITYLDADLYFHRSPEEVFAAIGDASVAITPHRFSPACADREVYGRFNVAWISWRNDPEGRRCLEDYRADCLAWCHDRLEGDRFADQKYLDRWPGRYENLRILDGKGVNLALWNVDAHRLHQADGGILVDEEPLIFTHFHGIKHVGPGSYDLRLSDYQVRNNMPFLVEGLYKPYLTQIEATFNALAPNYGLAIPGDPRFGKARDLKMETPTPIPASAPRPGVISSGYTVIDRQTAERFAAESRSADAWGHEDVGERQEAAYGELLREMRQGQPRIDLAVAAAAVAACGLDTPTLLEVGCASGYYKEVFDHLLGSRVRYAGIDRSDALIRLARHRRPGISFEVADATRLPVADASIDIVFNGVALMHILDYEKAIAESRRATRRFVIFHTVPLLHHRPTAYLTKQAYGRPTVEVILNEGELRVLFARHGLAVRRVWDSIPYDLSAVLGEVTPTRSFLCEVVEPAVPSRPALLNIGCGSHFHDDWVNLDVAPRDSAVMAHDVTRYPLPFADNTFDAVYHSHVLEHLPKAEAPAFLEDCLRVLKPGGVLRIAVPDLERICRLYLEFLERADAGDDNATARYDWMMLELLDQMVRTESGGEMLRTLRRTPLPAETFIIERIGREAKSMIAQIRAEAATACEPAKPRRSAPLPAETVGRFRQSGETHQWMYDRFSLRRLLREAGFMQARTVAAQESAIANFTAYGLDVEPDGQVRKPDSLFVEACKPT